MELTEVGNTGNQGDFRFPLQSFQKSTKKPTPTEGAHECHPKRLNTRKVHYTLAAEARLQYCFQRNTRILGKLFVRDCLIAFFTKFL